MCRSILARGSVLDISVDNIGHVLHGRCFPCLYQSLLLLLICGLFMSADAFAQTGIEVDRDALYFDRHELTKADMIGKIRSPSNKSGLSGVEKWGITGWFEYDFTVAKSGWYELIVTLAGRYANAEYIIDPQLYRKGSGGAYQFSSNQGVNGDSLKVMNVWLDAGAHVLRVQQYYWTGMPPITRLAFKHSPATLAGTVRAVLSGSAGTFRVNECQQLDVYSGGLKETRRLVIVVKDSSTGKVRERNSVTLLSGDKLTRQSVPVHCLRPGDYSISFTEFNGRPIAGRDIAHIRYEVIDTARRDDAGESLKKTLIQEIDCAATAPDYSGGGDTRVMRESYGAFRESGDVAWRNYQKLPERLRTLAPEPSWFAYKLDIAILQKPYLVEVDYPDDGQRSFAIALRESMPEKYPVAGGVDSGGEFSLSNSMHTHSLIFWPRAEDPRVVFMNARAGSRAAASRIRVYRIDSRLPALRAPAEGGRQFANWYEEGGHFASLYGLSAGSGDSKAAIERWAELARHMGIDVLFPTVSVYNFNFYPSGFNRAFSSPPYDDLLRRMLLIAERDGLKLIPDLHPRSDELSWTSAGVQPQSNVLISKDGATTKMLPPHFNPIHPVNQDWYVGMIGELVDRYRDSPALQGVGLRVMQWANPSLNNFHSLDWGYDDYTIDMFQRERGVIIPVVANNPARFRLRYEWLMANARDEWIEWRCAKIARLYKRISDRVRQARPDLKVYSLIFDAYPSEYGADWLKGAGLDVRKLTAIEGVELVNSLHAYGRVYDEISTQGTRDNLIDPDVLAAMKMPGRNGNVLPYARYFEATEVVLPPEKIGFDPATKKTWTSAVVNPSGRHYLERYAVALAETDAVLLGDGGNGYTLGQPLLQEFLREFRALPPVPFASRADARDPVAVWEYRGPGGYYFYAVNRERFAVELTLKTEGSGSITRLSTGEASAPAASSTLGLQLAPYQLLSFKGVGDVRITAAVVKVPAAEIQRVKAQVEWLEGLVDGVVPKRVLRNLSPKQRQTLQALGEEARIALSRGWVWRARTVIERHDMLKIYKSLGAYPPEFRNTIVTAPTSDGKMVKMP